ncbi:MAG: AMP-binding protein [Micrococcaceae bacterium]
MLFWKNVMLIGRNSLGITRSILLNKQALYLGSNFDWSKTKHILSEVFAGNLAIYPTMEQVTKANGKVAKDTAVVLSTSGSTGAAKQIEISKEAILASHQMVEDYFGNPTKVQWLLALSPERVAGLQVLIRAFLSDADLAVLSDLMHFDVKDFIEATAQLPHIKGQRRVSLVPTQLAKLLEDQEGLLALKTFDAVLIGGGPMWKELKEKAARQQLNIVQTYGMTESCGGCVYNGKPLKDVQVAIEADSRISLAGPILANNLGDKFITEDKGQLSETGILQVLGRADDVIITGGIKVSAHKVAEQIQELPNVQESFVMGVSDKQWGQKLVAFIVGEPDVLEIKAKTKTLTKAAVPKEIIKVPEIPYLASGKPDRQKLLESYT